MPSMKFPFTLASVTRLCQLFLLLLLLASGCMIKTAFSNWLTQKRSVITDISHAMQKRIDSYRYATWQLYEEIATDTAANNTGSLLQENHLRHDVYHLEKTRVKTEALIFGEHDRSTLDAAARMSDYLDTLWGPATGTWSMYFLNGQDNSLTLISTLSLRDMVLRYKEGTFNNIIDARRAEMLQQANSLDERESFSQLRRFNWQNDRYFTVRTTFNQPGHLATVVAFDLPINDIIPKSMALDSFQLRQNQLDNNDNRALPQSASQTQVSWVKSNIEVSVPVATTSLQLVYRFPISRLIFGTEHNLLWPLLINLLLMGLTLFMLVILRRQAAVIPGESQHAELNIQRHLNEEIVNNLPVGLLVYDFANSRPVISNKIAGHLLPHLNLQKIINMSYQHQGVLQATVNNEVYEIRHIRSEISPHTQLFIMRDQDRELLVNKKLIAAQQQLEKNHQTRQLLLQHLGQALHKPLDNILNHLHLLTKKYPNEDGIPLDNAQALQRLIDDIVLVNQLETQQWVTETAPFSLQTLLDRLAAEILPVIQRKGLSLIINNQLSGYQQRLGDENSIYKILATILHYAITTTTWGRISLTVSTPADQQDRLAIDITDTGAGLTNGEIANSEFPFVAETHQDRFEQASGMAFFLCRQLCKQLGGQFEIYAQQDIGSHYRIQLPAPLQSQQQQEEKLLEGVSVMVNIIVDDVRKIVVHQLSDWGAQCITPDERFSGQQHDILVTDDPNSLTPWSLLLTDDEAGFSQIVPGQYRVNFNISSAMQDALLQLIEQQLAHEELSDESSSQPDISQLIASGYFPLFVETVPDDVQRLYTEASTRDFSSLAQTAHRLKGVFAMLNLLPGKQLCETLELHINKCENSNIKNTISEIDTYVNHLLQQGNP